MKYVIVIGLMLFALCACDKAGDMRVLELDNGKYTVQLMSPFDDWQWIAKDGFVSQRISYIKRSCGGLLLFDNVTAACDYKEKHESSIRIKRVVECE